MASIEQLQTERTTVESNYKKVQDATAATQESYKRGEISQRKLSNQEKNLDRANDTRIAALNRIDKQINAERIRRAGGIPEPEKPREFGERRFLEETFGKEVIARDIARREQPMVAEPEVKIPTTAREFQVSLLERMGRKPRVTPAGIEYLETPERKVTITPGGRVVKAPPSAIISPPFVEQVLRERVKPAPIPKVEPLTPYEKRAERVFARQEKFLKGMERVRELAGFITFARGKPYEERGFYGKYIQDVTTAIVGAAPLMFAGIPLAAGKAAYISESLIRPETRLMTIQEAKRVAKGIPSLYDPRTPSGLATWILALALPLPRVIAKARAARLPIKYKQAVKGEMVGITRPKGITDVLIKPVDFAAQIGKMRVVGIGKGVGRITPTRIPKIVKIAAEYKFDVFTKPKAKPIKAEARLLSLAKLGEKTFKGLGAYRTVTKLGRRALIDYRVLGFKGLEFMGGEFPRYLVRTGEVMPPKVKLPIYETLKLKFPLSIEKPTVGIYPKYPIYELFKEPQPSLVKVGVVRKFGEQIKTTMKKEIGERRYTAPPIYHPYAKELARTHIEIPIKPTKIEYYDFFEKGVSAEWIKRVEKGIGFKKIKGKRKYIMGAGFAEMGKKAQIQMFKPKLLFKPKAKPKPKPTTDVKPLFSEAFMKAQERAIRKAYEITTRPRVKPISLLLPKTETMQRIEALQRTRAKSRIESMSRLGKMMRLETIPKTAVIPKVTALQRTRAMQRLETLQRLRTVSRVTPAPFTIPKMIMPPPPPLLFPFPQLRPPKRKKVKRGKRLLRYQPSLVPAVEKIFGKKPKLLTGLGIRPLLF